MKLNEKTIDELKNLKDMYLNRKLDDELFKYFLCIINSSHIFLKPIKFTYSNSNLYVNLGHNFNYEIFGSIDKCINYSKKLASSFSLSEEVILLFTFCQILHELTHIEQQELSYLENNSIGKLYQLLINNPEHLRNKIIYALFRYRICYERNANINAFRENKKIFPNEINDLFYLYNLFSYYKENSQLRVITPVEYTFYLFGIKDKITYSSNSFVDIMEHGCPLEEDNIKKYYSLTKLYEETDLSQLSIDKIYKKILELR